MRRRTFLLIGALVFALLLAGCGPAPAETTAPPVETTTPPETTLPPETTAPPTVEPEVTIPSVEEYSRYEELHQLQFEYYQGEAVVNEDNSISWNLWFKYEGTSPAIRIPRSNMTLTLPEGWLDRVSVIERSGKIYVVNNRIISSNWDMQLEKNPDVPPENLKKEHYDYMLLIRVIRKSFFEEEKENHPYLDPYEPYEGIYIGEDENSVYWAILPGDEMYDNNRYFAREFLIEFIGEDAYNELVGDLVLTYDMVREMVTISEPAE